MTTTTKITVGVFFGGRSVEHEISVISALQAIAALDAERYEAVPVYITKQGKWLTGGELLDTAAYRDMAALEKRAVEVYMKPVWGDHRLYRKGGLGERTVASLDIALPAFHGTGGEDGTFQGFLELIGIPYVGCNVLSSALGMDKIAMKMVLRESGIPVIDYVWFTDRQWNTAIGTPRDGSKGHGGSTGRDGLANGREAFATGRDELVALIETRIGYPAIVKPANLGSSVGISRALDREELIRAVGTATEYSSRILVEKMIEPLREINCSVLGNADDHRTSVCEEPVRSSEILSYADKYLSGGQGDKGGAGCIASTSKSGKLPASGGQNFDGGKMSGAGAKTTSRGMSGTKRRIPADLPEPVSNEIRALASETFRVLGCEGVARIDFILDESNTGGDSNDKSGNTKIYVNEINTIPGSLSFYLWEATGTSFTALMDLLFGQALKRQREKEHKTVSYSGNIFNMGSFGGGKTGK